MSSLIQDITISINGNNSKNFNIELQGKRYHLGDFSLSQKLLSPNHLSFSMRKGPDEDIDEITFSICGYLIGKDINITFKTEQPVRNSNNCCNTELCFTGVIMSADASRFGTEYVIHVEAASGDALLINNPNCRSFENCSLDNIVNKVITGHKIEPGAVINTSYKNLIPYCVQYNETDYQFLVRLAQRYGQWMLFDGANFIFGKLPDNGSVSLRYPNQGISSYHAHLNMRHTSFEHITSSYHSNRFQTKDGIEEMQKRYNSLSEDVFNASRTTFSQKTLQHLLSGGFSETDGSEEILNVSIKAQAKREKGGMLTYSGDTSFSGLKLGIVLNISDNYISDMGEEGRSDVEQNGILITEIIHTFSSDGTYANHFKGISSDCDYPCYSRHDVFPKASSCRAKVTANNDPKHLGRIRVQFAWQAQQDNKMTTPWLRIAEPYTGAGKGILLIPEIGEEVVVDFEGGNAERPFVIGCLFNGKEDPDHDWTDEENNIKAIRTRNGHTIEFCDRGEGGYIRIYDKGKDNYILTFSTDDKRIDIESSGDIRLTARKNIIIKAGGDVKVSADRNLSASAVQDIDISAFHDIHRTALNNTSENIGNNRETSVGVNDYLTVSENQFITVEANKEEKITDKYQISAQNIHIDAEEKLTEHSKAHHTDASDSVAISADKEINIKSSIVKIN